MTDYIKFFEKVFGGGLPVNDVICEPEERFNGEIVCRRDWFDKTSRELKADQARRFDRFVGAVEYVAKIPFALLDTACSDEKEHYSLVWDVCKNPDPKKDYPEAYVANWDPLNPKNSSLFVCSSQWQVEHYTCDEDFNLFKDITNCPEDYLCEEGECRNYGLQDGAGQNGSVSEGHICKDSDEKNDPMFPGIVWTESPPNAKFYSLDVTDLCIDYKTIRQWGCFPGQLDHEPTEKDLFEYIDHCPAGTICCFEACEPTPSGPPLCNDTDPLNDPFVKGYIDVGSNSYDYEDHCDSEPNKLKQYSCPNFNEKDPCSYLFINPDDYIEITDCAQYGMICEGGACVTDKSQSVCDDSDSDVSYLSSASTYIKGFVTASIGDETFIKEDKCSDKDTLIENYCIGNTWKAGGTLCQIGCKDGACIECSDDDDKNNPYVMGAVKLVNGVHDLTAQTDYCTEKKDIDDPSKLVQVDCNADGTDFEYKEIECKEGEACNGGVCYDPNKQ